MSIAALLRSASLQHLLAERDQAYTRRMGNLMAKIRKWLRIGNGKKT
jgi:hypothetical protein